MDKEIYWYMCGPTVYDYSHLGHARTYIASDVIRRILEGYFNKNVTLIMNITDIDDKIINKSITSGEDWYKLARRYEESFFRDMERLGIISANIITRVSDYIPEIITFIQNLLNKGAAYCVNGSVYFDIEKYIQDGNKYYFSNFETDNENNENNVSNGDGDGDREKRSKRDFALWKKSDNIGWDSPFGYGRPGWHIECSTMSIDVLKQINKTGELTIHSGGIDLAFPHHANEITQSESYLKVKSWVKFFMHIGHLNIQGQKMSKSLKNFIKVDDFLKDYDGNHGANILRMMILLVKYNNPMNYTSEFIEYAKTMLEKIENYFGHMENYERKVAYQKFKYEENRILEINEIEKNIDNHICNDLDIPKVITELLKLIEIGYISENLYTKKYVMEIVNRWYNLFGFVKEKKENKDSNQYLDIIHKIRDDIRTMAKNNKELYKLSDKIRDEYLKDINIQDL